MKYLVIGHVAASVSTIVEAELPEDAIDAADLDASLCHQCARDVSIGDVYAHTVVEDGCDGETVYDDTQTAPTMAARPIDLHGIVSRHDRLGDAARSRGVTQAVRDRAELIDWLRRSGVLPKDDT